MSAKTRKFNEFKDGAEFEPTEAADAPIPDTQARYRQPPKAYRFKPGQSGNPSGRPKGSTKRLLAELEAALEKPVVVREGGKRRRVSKLQAAAKTLADRVASGDPQVLKLLLGEWRQSESREAEEPAKQETLSAIDREVLAGMLARLRRAEQ